MDRVDQSVNAVFVYEALRVAKLIRVAAKVFNERSPMKRAAEIVGDGWTTPFDVLAAFRASGLHSTMVTESPAGRKRIAAAMRGGDGR